MWRIVLDVGAREAPRPPPPVAAKAGEAPLRMEQRPERPRCSTRTPENVSLRRPVGGVAQVEPSSRHTDFAEIGPRFGRLRASSGPTAAEFDRTPPPDKARAKVGSKPSLAELVFFDVRPLVDVTPACA